VPRAGVEPARSFVSALSRSQTMGTSRRPLPFALSLLSAVALAACSDGGDSLLRNGPETAQPVESMAYLRCTADVRAGTVACRETAPRSSLGGAKAGHYIYYQSAPHAVMAMNDYTASSSEVSFDLRVVNLVPQPIATDDGVTLHSRGVRVFFWSNPWVTDGTGSVSVIEPSTTGSFTGNNQRYHQWNEIIQSQDTSVAEKHYRFGITGTVNAFEFQLGISTNMQWTAITLASADAATLAVGDSVDLNAARVNALGDTMALSSITWASGNASIATVNSTSGLVHGVSAGTTNVIASQTPGRPDTVVITVN
jgi:Bacterial Ig-like domain (group 2)